MRTRYSTMIKPEIAAAMERHIDELRSSGRVARALKAGDAAPPFVLKDQYGEPISSVTLLARGPLVVSFFRGTWCPYCNEEIRALNEAYDRIRALGADLVAITPQSMEKARPVLTRDAIAFPVLVDPDVRVGETFRLSYGFPTYLADIYAKAFGNDLTLVNAVATWRLPISGRYVIATNGRIVDAQVDADYRYRPDPELTLAVLERLAAARKQPYSVHDAAPAILTQAG